jgi:tyrosine-protein phosphatase YwqE
LIFKEIFKRYNQKVLNFDKLPFQTDIHSHILPGIDDGSPDIETSIILLKGLSALGIKKMIATPHVIADLYRNTPEIIMGALAKLKVACVDENIDIEIEAAAEYMIDDSFIQMLAEGNQLLTIYDNLILTEQSFNSVADNLHEIAFSLLTNGYRPVLAHPERYEYYHNNYKNYGLLKEMGFLLQINVLSLTGYYGKSVAKVTEYLFENNLVDLVGTDLHHFRHLEMLNKKGNLQLIKKYIGNKNFNQLNNI